MFGFFIHTILIFQKKMNNKFSQAIEQLSAYESFKNVCRKSTYGLPMISIKTLEEIVQLTRAILFPGFFGNAFIDTPNIQYQIGADVVALSKLLTEQIQAGICFDCEDKQSTQKLKDKATAEEEAVAKTENFIALLPAIRAKLITDVESIYNGDPAAMSYGEIIFCYPAIRAITNYRVAHELLLLDVPIIPRIITEMAHSETGIDIHPGAKIGTYFSIDHGTGVVIGATTVIGNNVHLYQGVTLGAKSFPLDEQGNPIKGIPRHPIIEDNVIIYANATILGRITIGEGSIIGGNMWVTNDVPPKTKKYN
jgi:serine O-acetyltransferase